MADIMDYIDWRGDIGFDEVHVNEVDGLIFSQLIYVQMKPYMPDAKKSYLTIKQLSSLYCADHSDDEIEQMPNLFRHSARLLQKLAHSRRYADCILRYYIYDISEKEESQFSAVTIELPDGTYFISYSGTDHSVVGWKENFNLSYLDETPGQNKAKKYLKQVAAYICNDENINNKSINTRKLWIGGHSKGGNLAVFAAMHVDKKVQDVIIKVFNFDGPGFNHKMIYTAGYKRIFDRCGLDTKMVQSDSGAIGGSVSHEFMVITDTDAGENDVFYCNECDYSANSNHAVSNLPEAVIDGKDYFKETKVIDTPNTHSIEELSKFLNIPDTLILKSLVYIVDKKPVIALIRADKAVEETKLMNAAGGIEIRIASSAEIAELMAEKGFDAVPGFIGPKGMKGIKIIADETVRDMKNFVVGINETDKHLVGANLSDLETELTYTDIRLVQRGELCPQCGKPLFVTKGIEVGNIFKLGTKYSKPMNAVYTDINGKTHPYVMGCYGIGISRTAAAAVEAHYDEHGIKWPIAIAPYHVVIVPVNINDELQMKVAEKMYEDLKSAGVEVVLDDRDERAGVKFKDADLIGFPFRVTVGKTINDGFVEYKVRETGEQEKYTPEQATQKLIDIIKAVK